MVTKLKKIYIGCLYNHYHLFRIVLISLKKGIIEKISYESRAYESVDDNSLSLATSQNMTRKGFRQ